MEQRRLRLGDILDDYCPRERRVTNHAVVAMIEEDVKQTRCTTCDSEHAYKGARVPARRKKETPSALYKEVLAGMPEADEAPLLAAPAAPVLASAPVAVPVTPAPIADPPVRDVIPATDAGRAESPDTADSSLASPLASDEAHTDADVENNDAPVVDGPVHRPLIRATLPRPEGHTPERKAPDFTFRPAGGRFDSRNAQRHRGGHRQARNTHGQSQSGQPRFGGQRGPGHGGGPQGQRHGNRPGQAGGTGRPGQGRGPRPGGGRKRGR